MKKLFLIATILTSPVFAACPIDGTTDACIAEIKTSPVVSSPTFIQNEINRDFVGVEPLTGMGRNDKKSNNLRNFSATNQDYSYNSSCQFGVCRNTGTPKTFIDSSD